MRRRRGNSGPGGKLTKRPDEIIGHRLALAMGTTDVDAVMESMTPELMARWRAAYLSGQIDDHWQQAGMLAAVIVNVVKVLAQGLQGKGAKPMKEKDFAKPEDFIPSARDPDDKPEVDTSVFDFGEQLAARFGG